MSKDVRWRLAGMMALVYAVQGAFWPLLAVHLKDLGIDGRARGWIFATMPLGSFAKPLGAGHLVDRLLPAERFLALAYALGTGFLLVLARVRTIQPAALFALFLIYWLIAAPTYRALASTPLHCVGIACFSVGGRSNWTTKPPRTAAPAPRLCSWC